MAINKEVQGQPVAREGTRETAVEDYALRRVPATWTWSWGHILSSVLGAGTAMFFMSLGGTLAASYGTVNAILAGVYAFIIQGILSLVLIKKSSTLGLNVDLLSRGLGYGFMGSAITSIIYCVNFVMYFAIEGQIMGHAISQFTHIPVTISYLIVGVAFIPLSLYGMKFMTKFQNWSLPLYIILLISGVAAALLNPGMRANAVGWASYMPPNMQVGGLGLLGAMGVVNGLVGIVVLLINDFTRFAPKTGKKSILGPLAVAFIPENGFVWLIQIPIGALMYRLTGETDPGIYMVSLLGIGGLGFVLLTQVRINITNVYSGSLALANFFSRAATFVPGRKFWVYTMVALGTLSLFTPILKVVGVVLTFQGVFLFAWVGSLIADIVIVKGWLKIGPSRVEYRRAYLVGMNPVGLWAILIASTIGTLLAFGTIGGYLSGTFGNIMGGLSSLVAFFVAIIVHSLIAIGTKGQTYVVREQENYPGKEATIHCPICSELVDRDDLACCPEHQEKWICAHCCMKERNCGEACHKRTGESLRVS